MTLQTLVLTALLFLITSRAASPAKTPTTSRTAAPAKDAVPVRIVLVGDSTVTDEKGWGGGFAELAGPGVTVINTSSGGRSSKSFRDEGKWVAALKQFDPAVKNYMLIQFGHNDQPGKGPQRETIANTTFKANMARYATEARAAGFEPVLVTSLARRRFQPDGTIKCDLAPYAQATLDAAAATHTPAIDLHALSLPYFEKVGKAECERLAPRDPKDGKVDSTHLSPPWHKPVARLVIGALVQVEPSLAGRFDGSER